MGNEELPPIILQFHKWYRESKNVLTDSGTPFISFLQEKEITKSQILAFIASEKREKPNSNFIAWAEAALKSKS